MGPAGSSVIEIVSRHHRQHDDDRMAVLSDGEEEDDDEFRDEVVDGDHREVGWPRRVSTTTPSRYYDSSSKAKVCRVSFVVVLFLVAVVFLSGGIDDEMEATNASAFTTTTPLSPSSTTSTTSSTTTDNNTPTDRHHPTITSAPAPPATAHPTGCIFDFDRDRFDNENNFQNNVLFPGQYICSKNRTNNHEEDNRYRFGLRSDDDDKKGSFQLVLIDTMAPTHHNNDYDIAFMVYQPQLQKTTTTTTNDDDDVDEKNHYPLVRFSLQIDGTLALGVSSSSNNNHGGGKAIIASSSEPNKEMHLTEQCLEKHDCPYLHLHADGVLVVNYIDDNHEWQAKNAKHVYGYVRLHS